MLATIHGDDDLRYFLSGNSDGTGPGAHEVPDFLHKSGEAHRLQTAAEFKQRLREYIQLRTRPDIR